MSAYRIVYGSLVSFGTFIFEAGSTYLDTGPLDYTRPTGTLIGTPRPVDLLGQGAATLKSAEITFVYQILAPDPLTGGAVTTADWVEQRYNALVALTDGTTAGLSNQVQTLTIHKASLTGTVSALAALTSATPQASNRSYASLQLSLVFFLYADPV